jgi:HEAT repeat protein
MTAALADTNHVYRDRVAMSLGFFMAHDVGTNACLPPLIAALDDPDPQVRSAASRALRRLTNAPAR